MESKKRPVYAVECWHKTQMRIAILDDREEANIENIKKIKKIFDVLTF